MDFRGSCGKIVSVADVEAEEHRQAAEHMSSSIQSVYTAMKILTKVPKARGDFQTNQVCGGCKITLGIILPDLSGCHGVAFNYEAGCIKCICVYSGKLRTFKEVSLSKTKTQLVE
jgi:hypothetical protein